MSFKARLWPPDPFSREEGQRLVKTKRVPISKLPVYPDPGMAMLDPVYRTCGWLMLVDICLKVRCKAVLCMGRLGELSLHINANLYLHFGSRS